MFSTREQADMDPARSNFSKSHVASLDWNKVSREGT